MVKDKMGALVAALNEEDIDDGYEDDYFLTDQQNEFALDEFFLKVDTVRALTDRIRNNMKEVKDKQDTILCTPNNDEKTKHQLEELMDDIAKTAKQVRAKLREIKADEEEEKSREISQSSPSNSVYSRIRYTQLSTLSTTITEIMIEYNTIQVDYREKCKARLQRQLEIAGKQTTDEELELLLEEGTSAVFTRDIITETQQARQSVADIEARHAEIVKLEKSIRELHAMFGDMVILVENQGEILDRIQVYVDLAQQLVGDGKVQINQAQVCRDNYLKKKITVVAILVVVLSVLIIILTLSLS